MQTFRAITRTRAFTPGFKLFAGLATLTFTATFLFGLTSTGKSIKDNLVDSVVGPMTLGWKGDVGNHAGYVVLLSITVAACFLAGLLVAFRDADPQAEAELLQADSVPLTRAPYGTSYWPIVSAFGVGAVVVGLVDDMRIFWAGIAILVLVTGVWTFRAWAERATGDDATNMEIYHRFIDPVRVPVTAVILVGLVAVSLSRVNLAMPSGTASIAAFGAVGSVLFLVFVLLNFLPDLRKPALAALLVVAAALFLGAGIVGAGKGDRFSHEGTGAESEGHGSSGEAPAGETPKKTEGGMAPAGNVTDGAVR